MRWPRGARHKEINKKNENGEQEKGQACTANGLQDNKSGKNKPHSTKR